MTLEEMNAAWEADHAPKPRILGVLPGLDDDDTTDIDAEFPDDSADEEDDDSEAHLCNAVDLLEEVMEVCGKFGQLRTHIGREEKRELVGLAQQIYEFLDSIGELDEDHP